MADAFYPFVENGGTQEEPDGALVVRYPARIAVFDDVAAAPRVVVVEPKDIRSYLEEITATVTKLAQEQGGGIPFTVIREVVENLIHAYFIEPTVSILDGGNTIRFSDQGPGIKDKDRALEYGTTSATLEMKRYIRGVGSGLPYAQQFLEDKGGSLTVEDNIHKGTVVTVSLVPQDHDDPPAMSADQPPAYPSYPAQTMQPWQAQGMSAAPQANAQGWPAQPPQQGYVYTQPAYPMQGYPQGAYGQQWPAAPAYPAPYPMQQPYQAAPAPQSPAISERGMLALQYLMTHESVGPRDLIAIQPLSESTWSRELSQLEAQGLLSKQGGQKRRLTALGRQMLGI